MCLYHFGVFFHSCTVLPKGQIKVGFKTAGAFVLSVWLNLFLEMLFLVMGDTAPGL